ncbi:MAG: TonB family protein [Woeseiaceae bacterium]|nr:TonB family protein [Woeseiaceae bacterium]
MFTRIASAVTSGTFITLSLLWVMNHLIGIQPGVIVETRDRGMLNFHPRIEDTPVETRQPPIVTPEQLTHSEPTPPRPDQGPAIDAFGVPVPTPPTPPVRGDDDIGILSDGPLVAIMRAQPVYPIRAQEQGLEGNVLVQFDVMPDGTVTNVIVLESSHSVFERPAIEAAERFRFKARVVEGVPQATYGLRNLFTFEMETN